MPSFVSYDGVELSYRVLGDGPPVVCLPGGPGRAVEYLGEFGGLDESHQLILLDPRGVGGSADPTDPATLRVVAAGHAFVQNLRRGHDEHTIDIGVCDRVRVAFAELAPCR